jgi:hypothetical protein
MSKAFYYKGKQYRFLMKSQQLIFFLGLCLVKKPKHHAFRCYLFVAAFTKRIYASIIQAALLSKECCLVSNHVIEAKA